MSDPISIAQDESVPEQEEALSVNRLIALGMVTRLFVDSSVQIFLPFLPVIANGMGISTIVLGRLVSLRSAMGLVSPFFGTAADRKGYRYVMRIGLFLGSLGLIGIGLSSSVWLAAVSMICAGLGTFAFVPTLQAYLSSQLPYHRRARGIGILEYAWALSGMIGLFLIGQLMEIASWRIPFFILGGGLFIACLFYGRLPAARDAAVVAVAPASGLNIDRVKAFLNLGPNARSAWGVITSAGLIMFSAIHLFIAYGAWLFERYGLGPADLGRVALVMGVADLCGSVSVSLFSDRLGKRRSVLMGLTVTCLGFIALPFFDVGLVWALIGLVIVRLSFEFSVVSNMTLLSEQAPAQRGKVMTLGAAAGLTGSTLAGFTGPWAFEAYGVWGLGMIPAVALFITLVNILGRVRERETPVADAPLK